MAQKHQESIRLSRELWLQVDDLEGYFGDGKSEVVAYILRNWLSNNQQEIRDTKARIDSIRKQGSRRRRR